MKPCPHLAPLGIIGVGNMGMGMALRWRSLGGQVEVHDRDAKRVQQAQAEGCTVHASPQALAQALPDAALLIVCVVDAQQCRDVLFGTQGAAAHRPAQSVVMLCPTISPQDTESIAADLADHGVSTIDAPMSGGPLRAAQGTMSLMVACADPVWAQHGSTLGQLAQPIFRVGTRVGDGARTKLVNNLLAGINLVGAAEALALAERMGLDAATTLNVIEASSGQSWIGSDRMRRALQHDFAPRAHMTLLAKDTGLAVAAAQDLGFSGPLGATAAATFHAATGRWSEADDAAMLEHLRQSTPAPPEANG